MIIDYKAQLRAQYGTKSLALLASKLESSASDTDPKVATLMMVVAEILNEIQCDINVTEQE